MFGINALLRKLEWRAWKTAYDLLRVMFDAGLNWKSRYSEDEPRALQPLRLRFVLQHDVIHGRAGFLFHRDHDSLEQFRGAVVLSARQVTAWKDALRRRDDWCHANGCKTRFLIIPEKHIVYKDYLPPSVKISERRPVRQLLGAIDDALAGQIIYPLEELRAASARRPTFLKTDTHWTSFGAFVAYQALIRSLRSEMELKSVEESELTWHEEPFVGDLGVRQEPELGEDVAFANPPAQYALTFLNRVFARGAVHVYTGERAHLPTCVLFRDSFSNALVPFLMQSFSRVVAVSNLSCLYDLLESEKPDVVIFAVIERFLATFGQSGSIELPDSDREASFFELTGVELNELKGRAVA